MVWSLDARVPLVFAEDSLTVPEGGTAGPSAVLTVAPPPPLPPWAVAGASFDAGVTAGPHAAGCACCQGRGGAALALDRLFQARARGACPWFARVVVAADAASAVRAALRDDALSAARFREAG